MALSKQQIQSVENTIRNSLRNRFKTYNPEPAVMPLFIYTFDKYKFWNDNF